MAYPYLFSPFGEWIGFVSEQKEVYSVLGQYVGYIGDGPRVLRLRSYSFNKPSLTPPRDPGKINAPPTVPLARLMSELPMTIVDILHEEPDRLFTSDSGELREDLS